MDKDTAIYVGLDVHKESVAISVAETGRSPARYVGTFAHDAPKLIKTLNKLGAPEQLHVVYEAGPTGYGLQRALKGHGYVCEVIAPSQIPRRAGDRIKTDRRDSLRLAECSRAGELHPVWIPDEQHEAVRDLFRAREDAVRARMKVRQQLKGFLLRHGVRYPGKTSWTKTFYQWLGSMNFEHRASQTAFTEYWLAVQAGDEHVKRLDKALQASVQGWRFEPVVDALQALRGIDVTSAIGLVVEIGDLSRFDHPRKLMGYLGLVPSQHSSGDKISRGSITKTGNSHARRLLTEAAWNYRFKARICRQAQQRQQALPEHIRSMAWSAQVRLTQRFAALDKRGVQRNKVCVAVARELAGFVWAIGTEANNAVTA
ncbi:MAG: IS110 family transposase [Undibacterium sp.]|uniref:IS110 family transposase n=1 Tax=Undibacterium sp. TaxID=1914977 RepID=UPI00271ED672|nr:IS110 family transposase [Undibacterium sp.]MDO8651673.1 IS110 family transposase [Undibacterium sp.]